jgi:hypothetical protein
VKTIFGLFVNFEDAEQAVDSLLEDDFVEEEMNVIVQEMVAKEELDVSLEKANVAVTEEVGEKTAHGLDAILAGQQTLRLPEVEDVYAAGEMATIMAKTAAAPGASAEEFRAVLHEFGVPDELSGRYTEGISGGGLLLWIRSNDDRAAKAADLLRENHGAHVDAF